jgi:hypothetical protein
MLRRTYPFAVVCILLAVIGCTSMTSTMLTRDENNRFWTRKGPLKGVPITLKVPTHVQLTVFERHYMVNDANGRAHRLTLPYVVRDFSQEFIYTEKIFTVDYKHPAAGTYKLDLTLTEDQYIQKFQHDVTDTTIAQVTALVGKLAPRGLPNLSSAARAEDYYTEIQSVVAVEIFEIDAPDFEEQMAAFINCHLNQAHDAWVAPPDVDSVHRVGISGFKEGSNICEGDVAAQNPSVPEIKFCKPQPSEPWPLPCPPGAAPTEVLPEPVKSGASAVRVGAPQPTVKGGAAPGPVAPESATSGLGTPETTRPPATTPGPVLPPAVTPAGK